MNAFAMKDTEIKIAIQFANNVMKPGFFYFGSIIFSLTCTFGTQFDCISCDE